MLLPWRCRHCDTSLDVLLFLSVVSTNFINLKHLSFICVSLWALYSLIYLSRPIFFEITIILVGLDSSLQFFSLLFLSVCSWESSHFWWIFYFDNSNSSLVFSSKFKAKIVYFQLHCFTLLIFVHILILFYDMKHFCFSVIFLIS